MSLVAVEKRTNEPTQTRAQPAVTYDIIYDNI